ncbi:MAG: hypothetical protein ACRDS9_18100 [Pseudonocardiaceae bacterium]
MTSHLVLSTPPNEAATSHRLTYRVHVDLPVMPPIKPMLAKPAKGVPTDGGLAFEPKWDHFCC